MGTSEIERFTTKYEFSPDTRCWVWVGKKTASGYGLFSVKGRWVRAHRWAYMTLVGPLVEGMQIDHLCRNRACVNPSHLEQVTQQENIRRGRSGEAARQRNLAKTHCPKGHEYSPENTFVSKSGSRSCRTCNRARWKAHRRKKKEQAQCPSR